MSDRKPLIEMPVLPEGAGLYEYTGAFLHGSPYRVYCDGMDAFIYETKGDDLKHLCKMQGPEGTERLAILLLRAAAIQRANQK